MALLKNLIGAFTANGNSAAMTFGGGKLYFGAIGTFGAGTLNLYASFDEGATFVKVPNSVINAEGMLVAELPDCVVKVTLSGATSPSLSYFIARQTPI